LQHDVTRFFEPDVLAEDRFYRAHRKIALEPERALLFAVLTEAIETFRTFAFSKSAREQNLFRQAKEWLCDGDPNYFFSCKNICEMMDLDPCYLRRGLLQWLERQKDSMPAGNANRNANKVAFARIGRSQHRTVYKQRRAAVRENPRRVDGGCAR
jgi:hypothetical protein